MRKGLEIRSGKTSNSAILSRAIKTGRLVDGRAKECDDVKDHVLRSIPST